MSHPGGHQDSSRFVQRFRSASLVVFIAAASVLLAAYLAFGSGLRADPRALRADGPHPWEFSPNNERERDHLEAADFLANLNFFEDGHGLVLPPSLTAERIENLVGMEDFAKLSGLVYDEGKLYGVREETIESTKVMVAGCGACHIGKAAGIVVPGLGNKTADFFGLVNTTKEMVSSTIALDAAMNAGDDRWQRANQAGSESFVNISEHPEYDSGKAGSITQFFALEMAYEKLNLPPLEKPLYAPVKAPSFWGYGPKRKVGVFSDALLKGSPAGAAGLPLFIGNYKMDVFEKNMETYEAAEQQFEKLLPPEYPFTVDRDSANRGKEIFANHCVDCHGEHERDSSGLPLFVEPNFVELDVIETDPLRATVFDQGARERFAETPLAPYLQTTGKDPGYIAPNLWGVWARFPYLHNGSVANIEELLTEPENRTPYIDLVDIGEAHRFDEDRLGATTNDVEQLSKRAAEGDRWVFDTTRKGFSNAGHDFGTDLSDSDKQALIEYLKTL